MTSDGCAFIISSNIDVIANLSILLNEKKTTITLTSQFQNIFLSSGICYANDFTSFLCITMMYFTL